MLGKGIIMNILLIGNGFDLAHELPTKYTDFLFFCKIILNSIEYKEGLGIRNSIEEWLNESNEILLNEGVITSICAKECAKDISARDKKAYSDMCLNYLIPKFSKTTNSQESMKEIIKQIYNNNWIEYFLQCDMHGKENWIDFESQISDVIQGLEEDLNWNEKDFYSKVHRLKNEFFNNRFTNNNPEYQQAVTVEEQEKIKKPEISYKELRDILLADLNRLIKAFEIYLYDYVEKIEITEKSPDINSIKVHYVISFNYTHTFSRLYKINEMITKTDIKPYDYIHGEVNGTLKTNNMVLGIDEKLPKNRRNKSVEFIAFKKYYQRIYKGTGCKYKDWIDRIKKGMMEIEKELKRDYPVQIPFEKCIGKHHYLYIFGHSLDVTDKDILKGLILNDNVKTTIFYHDQDAMGQQIANLVKIIGQKELIRRTGGNTKTIFFKLQGAMEPIVEDGCKAF